MPSHKSEMLQYLRALACLLVVASHASGYAAGSGRSPALCDFLLGGVDIFFVISGCVMWLSTCRSTPSPWTFYQARLIRIVPLYWLVTLFLVVLSLLFPTLLQTARFDPDHVLASLAFVAWPHPSLHLMFPVLVSGWTLNYEMAFYFVFGLVLRLDVAFRLSAIVAAGVLACAVHWLFGGHNPLLDFYTDPIVLEFVAGTLIGALLAKARPERGRSAPVAALVIGIALLVMLPEIGGIALPRVVMSGLPAAIIVCAALLAECRYRPRSRPFALLLGDASYSIYLVHTIVLAVLGHVWMRFGVQAPIFQIMFFTLAVVASTAAGVLVHAVVERPLLRATRAMIGGATRRWALPGPQKITG